MYQVLENGKPAQYPNYKVDPSWDTSIFDSEIGARAYAIHWLGIWAPTDDPEDSKAIPLNTPIDFDGYGDTIEIREF